MANCWILTVIVLLSIFGPGSHTRATKLDNTCNDGKRLYNTSNGVSLFIPNISMEDEGFYYCDLLKRGGGNTVNVSVSVIRLKTRLDIEHGQRIAVCEATYKKTKPTLHWEPALNFSFKHTSNKKVDKFSIIENRVHLPDNVTISDLTCVASYPSVSGSLQHKSTLHITTQATFIEEIRFCLRMKEETPTQEEMKKYGG